MMNWKEITVRKCSTGYIVMVKKFTWEEHAFKSLDDVRNYLDKVFGSERKVKNVR